MSPRTAQLLVFAIAFLGLCSCTDKGTATALRLGYIQNDLHHLPAFVALEKGFFTAQGLTVQVAGVFKAGPEEMSAFGADELDIGYVGQAPATAAALNGVADVRFIAQVNQEGSAIVSRKGSGIRTIGDLVSRTVAIPGHATIQDFLLRRALDHAGIGFGQVRAMVLKPPEMLQALDQKQIDAFIAWQPYPALAAAGGAAQVLADSSDIWKGHPCCVLAAKTSLCSQQPDLVAKIRAAHRASCAFIAEHPGQALDIAMRYTSLPRSVLEEALRHVKFTDELDQRKGREFIEFLTGQGYVQPGQAQRSQSLYY